MSTFKVPVTEVVEINPHPNAHSLELAKVYDWQVVVGKGQFKPGDHVIYVPVDSLLPQELEDKIFQNSKVKLNKHRIKSIKLRGQISQGLIIDPVEIKDNLSSLRRLPMEGDVSQVLNITKYEPPVKSLPQHMQVKKKKKLGNSNFQQYSSIENFKYYDRTFQDDEQVYISEKLHGTSFRCGWFPMEANTVWKKIKKYFKKLPEFEFCYGSRTVEISSKPDYNGWYGHDVYGKMVKQYNLKDIIPEGYAIYAEIVGDGIQKNFSYGCGTDEHKMFVYDIMETKEGRYLDYPQFVRQANAMDLPRVPLLYIGTWNKNIADCLRDGSSVVGGNIREGIVIRSVVERKTGSLSRVILKYISDAYYLKQAADEESTEFH